MGTNSKRKEDVKSEKTDFRHMVRVSDVVLDGNKEVIRAIAKIKGIGIQSSKSLAKILGIGEDVRLGSLDEKQIERIETTIKELDKYLPTWMMNRQRDRATGKNLHITGPDLEITQRDDINLQKKLKSYRGIRHSFGLPVRGQRTRTSFRHGVTIGVSRKKVIRQKAEKKEKEKGGKK